ncbi:MAG TPA: hypothetical protein VKF82_00975 [Candidatus Eremiobacteraceae bacterium]|nr:hypothetical protein [Candidatus Eremiobacteraceae bacterium]
MAPVTARLRVAAAIAVVLIAAYAALALAGFAPWPRSIVSIAGADAPHRGYALVSGYYLAQPFISNGNGLPPYEFGEPVGTHAQAASVHVAPALSDLRAYRVVAVIDTATGDGSEWNPYQIHTVGSVDSVVLGATAGGAMLLALVFWGAGYIAMMMPARSVRNEARRVAG